MHLFKAIYLLLRTLLLNRAALAAENLALRQQLAILQHVGKRPRLRRRDRTFWVWLARLWKNWASVLVIVKPETVIRWHRQGFRYYWRWKSRKAGRPKVPAEIRALIRQMSEQNPTWGAPRIQSELRLLGYDVALSTVARYMARPSKPSWQTWRAFLKNHMAQTAAIDFFTVPTATFRILFCFIVLKHERRQLIHFNVTAHPTAEWTAQQIVEAFPYDQAPRYLLRDRDSTYGERFVQRLKNMGIEQVVISPRSPWQNPYAERIIGSIRRECLDHVIVLGEDHLHRILTEYVSYYNRSRTHLSLDGNAPTPRDVEKPSRAKVVAIPKVGGLHHRYARVAA